MNEQNQNPTNQPKPSMLRFILAWAISLLVLFVMVYVISKAWKKGQVNG